MNLDFLKGNPALNDISPEKLQFLMDFASNNADTSPPFAITGANSVRGKLPCTASCHKM